MKLTYNLNLFSEPRYKAMQHGLINKQREPFSVRDKSFWELSQAKKLLEPKFLQTLGHEPDGLIFQPSEDVCSSQMTFYTYHKQPCNVLFRFLAIHSWSM